MDFAENNEIVHKIEHWSHTQVTLYIVVTHHRTGDNQLKTEAQIFVSSDRFHDTYFVQHALSKLQKSFKMDKGKVFKRWYINTDGAPSHFKSKYTMNYMKKFLEQCNEDCKEGSEKDTESVMWEFCAPGHGKGPWDGVGAVIKRLLRQLERTGMSDGKKIYNRTAFDCFFTLQEHYKSWTKDISERYSIDQFNFFYIPENNAEAKTISTCQDANVEASRTHIMSPINRPAKRPCLTNLAGIRKEYFCFLAEADKNTNKSNDEMLAFCPAVALCACRTISSNANKNVSFHSNRLF